MWQYRGQKRPEFADVPGSGQESVWDYPRPPKIEADTRLIQVKSGSQLIASTTRSYRIMETASPPTFYLPPQDIDWNLLKAVEGESLCEWKGLATYWGLSSSPDSRMVGWSYPETTPSFSLIRDHVCFYPGILECFVDDERVQPQPGRFYGGWITKEIVGPFKGEPGTEWW